jgi:hypothetical protein
MRWLRYFWTLSFLTLFPAATLVPAQQPATAPETPTAPRPDSKGAEWLKEAISALDAKRQPWVEAELWQHVDVHGVCFQADGRYYAGPENRLRMEWDIHLENSRGSALVVSDGRTIWDRLDMGPGTAPIVRKIDLGQVVELLQAPGITDQFRMGFWGDMGFLRMAPLLRQIEQQMVVTHHEPATWQNRPVTKLTAFWSEAVSKNLAPRNQVLPAFMPRKCYLYLDAEHATLKYWPYRIEWWGPAPGRRDDSLLLQMEYREPKLGKALSAEEMARIFSFDPGTAKVEDLTEHYTQRLRNVGKPPSGPGSGN